jgi:hypothetical protein
VQGKSRKSKLSGQLGIIWEDLAIIASVSQQSRNSARKNSINPEYYFASQQSDDNEDFSNARCRRSDRLRIIGFSDRD